MSTVIHFKEIKVSSDLLYVTSNVAGDISIQSKGIVSAIDLALFMKLFHPVLFFTQICERNATWQSQEKHRLGSQPRCQIQVFTLSD